MSVVKGETVFVNCRLEDAWHFVCVLSAKLELQDEIVRGFFSVFLSSCSTFLISFLFYLFFHIHTFLSCCLSTSLVSTAVHLLV